MRVKREREKRGDALSGEFDNLTKCEQVHLTGQMLYGLSPNPYTNRKSKHARRKSCMSALFCFRFGIIRLAFYSLYRSYSDDIELAFDGYLPLAGGDEEGVAKRDFLAIDSALTLYTSDREIAVIFYVKALFCKVK